MNKPITLFQLQEQVREGLTDLFPDALWVVAEVSSVQVKSNGHCYMDLCQSSEGGLCAKAKAIIWRNNFALINAAYRKATGGPIQPGAQILFLARVNYSELYGLSLIIEEIEPQLTIGAAELRRRQTIERLQAEGMMQKQQELTIPPLPRTLAVISAQDAAGYGDFLRHLTLNDYGFRFEVDLFPATMQGDGAPASIIDALEAVQTSAKSYQAVLILRGGGSALDLACFDDYDLCFSIACCPLPVFSAIGHDRDFHIIDMVSHRFVKTPTALADLFIDCFLAEDEALTALQNKIKSALRANLVAQEGRLQLLLSRIVGADPRKALERGFALPVSANGVVLKRAADFAAGDTVKLLFADGEVTLEVKKVYGK